MAQDLVENLHNKHIGSAEWKGVARLPQSQQLARTSQPPLPKSKRTDHGPHHKIVKWERDKMGTSSTLAREEVEREHAAPTVASTLKEGSIKEKKGGHASPSQEEEKENMSG